jgi:hypothetical protein
MNYSILQAIMAFIFGHKYYANIINTRGTERYEIASYIFFTRQQAEEHRRRLEQTRSFEHIETVTFRSRKNYCRVSQ